MIKQLLDANIARVRQRVSEADCPVTPALSVETLEHMVIDLAGAPTPGPVDRVTVEGLGPNGMASAQVEKIATAVMRWVTPHLKHMVAFSTLCEAIETALPAEKDQPHDT